MKPRGRPIDVGLVGLGTIAETHLAVLAERADVRVAFAVDPRPGATGAGRGVPRYDGLGAALHAHEPDVVVIVTPTDTHAELARTALVGSSARVLVEKPLAHDRAALGRLTSLAPDVDVRSRLFVAHHFAFAPEVLWAAEQLAAHPEWGPVTRASCAFNDPYVLRGDQAPASYGSSWLDSGANELSMLARFVDLAELQSTDEYDGGTTSWSTVGFRAGGTTGTARLLTNWQTGASSKRTTIELGRSGVELWLDHTAMTGFAVGGERLLSRHVNDGATPRKVAHYRPLYESVLSADPDPILGLDTAVRVVQLLTESSAPSKAT